MLGFGGFSYATFEYAVDKYYKENIDAAYPQFKILAEQGMQKLKGILHTFMKVVRVT